VEATFTLPRRFAKTIELRQGERRVPSVLLSAVRASDDSIQEARLAIRADAPPLGFASYEVVAAASATSSPAAAEGFWNLRPDTRGGIASIVNRKAGQTMLRNARFAATIDGKACESEGTWRTLRPQEGSRWVTARETGAIGGIPYRLDVTQWADSPRIDLRVEFEFDGERIGTLSENKRDGTSPFIHETKLRFKFFPVTGEEGAMGIRDLPFVIGETPSAHVQGNYWTAIGGSAGGVAVFNRGTM
jgi:hypothetical protein